MTKATTPPKVWFGPGNGLSGTWSTAANWVGNQPPVTGDNVIFPAADQNPPYIVTYDITSNAPALGSITLNTGSTLAIGAQDLVITGSGTAISDQLLVASGAAITIDGGSITAGGVTLDGALSGLGCVTILTNVGTPLHSINGGGVITATGGTLALTSDISLKSRLTFVIADTAASVLKLNGNVGAQNTFTFAGTHGALELNNVPLITPHGLNFLGTVSGLDVAAGTASPDLGTINYVNIQATITSASLTDSTHIALYNGSTNLGTITLASATVATHVNWFVDSGHLGSTIGSGTDLILSDTVCFAAGTHIRTPSGDRLIETLQPGDEVMALAGEGYRAERIKWIGQRRIDLVAHPRPQTVAPVRIQRDAFGNGVPYSDLVVSPAHAIFVDGKLICARQLINGATIRRQEGWTSVVYFHVELDAHGILLAEGLPTESYLDTGNRGFFANGGAPLVLHPDLTSEADYPTRAAASCAPFAYDEATVRPVWQKLADRAAELGLKAPEPGLTSDSDLHLVVGGRTLLPLSSANGLFMFVLPRGTTKVVVESRAGSPADVWPWRDDERLLGVRVERIVLRHADDVTEIALDDPNLSEGWWAVEREGVSIQRWTNGRAVLKLRDSTEPAVLEIRVGGRIEYVVGAGDRAAA